MTYIRSDNHQFPSDEERDQYWTGLFIDMARNLGKFTDHQMNLDALECLKLEMEESLIAPEIFLSAADKSILKVDPALDIKFYERIKPFLLDAWKVAKSAHGNTEETLDTFVDDCIERMGDKVIPYMQRYYREVRACERANTR